MTEMTGLVAPPTSSSSSSSSAWWCHFSCWLETSEACWREKERSCFETQFWAGLTRQVRGQMAHGQVCVEVYIMYQHNVKWANSEDSWLTWWRLHEGKKWEGLKHGYSVNSVSSEVKIIPAYIDWKRFKLFMLPSVRRLLQYNQSFHSSPGT